MNLKPAALVAALALLTACGSTIASTAGSSSTSPSAPTPHRIVSMSPTATEMLFAIGAGGQVVAVDSNSNYPDAAPKTNLSAYQPNVEAIARYTPDLVIVADDTKDLTAQLRTLKIPVLVQPAATTLDDSYREIAALGDKTGHRTEAARLVVSMRARISQLVAGLPHRTTPLTYYHELDNTLYTVTSKTFLGQLYALAGLRNIADAADRSGGGYPQLSAEYLVKADPDLVFLADTKCCELTAAKFAARPGFSKLKAVRAGHVVLLDDDVASRWGPRVVDLLQRIVGAVKAIPAQ